MITGQIINYLRQTIHLHRLHVLLEYLHEIYDKYKVFNFGSTKTRTEFETTGH